MKRLLLTLLTLSAAGCMSHDLPRDSYLKGVESKLSTPWGSHELKVNEAATGTAAKNITMETTPPAKKP